MLIFSSKFGLKFGLALIKYRAQRGVKINGSAMDKRKSIAQIEFKGHLY